MKVFAEKGNVCGRNGYYVSTIDTDTRFWFARSLKDLAKKLPYEDIEFVEDKEER